MPPEISMLPKLEFKELLSHTFPGFFFALSVFMLLDVLSPKDLTLWAFGTLTKFVSAMGFIILLGTILGILIDGIQHLIEEGFFKVGLGYKKRVSEREEKLKIYPQDVKHYYYYKLIGTDKDAYTHLTDNYYRYAEFYGNIFISLIAFSCIAPFYFCYFLGISWGWSIIFGCVVPFFLALICIYSSYRTFVVYHSNRIDMILGFLDWSNYIEVSAEPDHICANGLEYSKITAQLKEWKCKKNVSQEVKIEFETDNGKLSISNKLLFEVKADYNCKQSLIKGNLCEALKEQFNKRSLSVEEVSKKIDEEHWEVVDCKMRYIIEDTGGSLKIYKIDNGELCPQPIRCKKGSCLIMKTPDGKASVYLSSRKSGIATVTASSKHVLYGKIEITVEKK